MNTLRIAVQNVRALWKRWLGLGIMLGVSMGLCLSAFGVTDNIAAASNTGILEATANRSIVIERDTASPESKILSQDLAHTLSGMPGVRTVEPRVQTSFGYKGPDVPGVLLNATTPRPSYLPPILATTRHAVFPLKHGEVVLPKMSDGMDLTATLGKSIPVELTKRTGTNDGVGVQRRVTVVGLFDPSWQLDGQSAAYAAPDTVTQWAALDAGTPTAAYLSTVGYGIISVTADTSGDVPTLLRTIQDMGYSASSLQQQMQALPVVLSLVKTMSRVLLVVVALIALIGAFTMSSALVRQRTREIGICKASGLSSTTVFGIFIIEALLCGIVAAVAGLLLGGAGTVLLLSSLRGLSGLGDYLPHAFALPGPGTVVLIVLTVLLVTVLGAVLPARRAARMDPVEAIAHW